jgi:hypothetical protein
LAVQELKRRPLQEVASRAQEIWQEFLAPGAPSAINVDSKSYAKTTHNIKDPGRYTFEDAQVIPHSLSVPLNKAKRNGKQPSLKEILPSVPPAGAHLQADEERLVQPLPPLQLLPGAAAGQEEGET